MGVVNTFFFVTPVATVVFSFVDDIYLSTQVYILNVKAPQPDDPPHHLFDSSTKMAARS